MGQRGLAHFATKMIAWAWGLAAASSHRPYTATHDNMMARRLKRSNSSSAMKGISGSKSSHQRRIPYNGDGRGSIILPSNEGPAAETDKHMQQRKNTYLRFHIIRWKTIIKDPHGLIDTNARFVCREIIIMAGSVILYYFISPIAVFVLFVLARWVLTTPFVFEFKNFATPSPSIFQYYGNWESACTVVRWQKRY